MYWQRPYCMGWKLPGALHNSTLPFFRVISPAQRIFILFEHFLLRKKKYTLCPFYRLYILCKDTNFLIKDLCKRRKTVSLFFFLNFTCAIVKHKALHHRPLFVTTMIDRIKEGQDLLTGKSSSNSVKNLLRLRGELSEL